MLAHSPLLQEAARSDSKGFWAQLKFLLAWAGLTEFNEVLEADKVEEERPKSAKAAAAQNRGSTPHETHTKTERMCVASQGKMQCSPDILDS